MRRLWLVVPWALFAAGALAWVGYWLYLADAAERGIASWRDKQREGGAHVSYERVVRHGFPVLMRLELVNLSYAPARQLWRAQTPSLDINLQMLNPRHLIVQAKAPITVTKADGAVETLRARTILASLRMQGQTLAQAGIEADDLVYDDVKPGDLRVRKLVANLRPDPRAGDHYQLSLETTAITLARPVRGFEQFGQEIASLRAAAVIEHGAALVERGPGDLLRAWREAGGRARIEAIELRWGPLEGTGQGYATIDDQHRLAGELGLALPHPGPPMRALAQSGRFSRNERQLLDALGRGLEASGRSVTFKIVAREGELRVDNTRVRTLDPLY